MHAARIVDIRGYATRAEAAAHAGIDDTPQPTFSPARQVVPILNVADLAASLDWFARLGWTKRWTWSASDGPGRPGFGSVASGDWEIFLCQDGQGGRGADHGVWLSIWIDDVDALYAACQRANIEVLQPPQNEPWGVREMHIRHPDGHVFRMSQPAPHLHS